MKKSEMILKSIGTYPPTFVTDISPYRNCYAHALNCMYEDKDFSVYSPGAIYATFKETDLFFENEDFYFRADLCIKLIKRDCSVVNINANCCDFDSKVNENTSQIVLTYSKQDNDFHFLRQNADGLWSHKPGFGSIRRRVKSERIDYHGESSIEIYGVPYKVIEIMKLQKK